ncbi:hypothetical protein PHLGIDRAFT_121380 [Phlebiopsis gigantea 11061_1 CR5-6]|uniref:Uncharacterized protein n=1 Tax=Phlebiopsis gigantea (strain 11061_1 CR5-6) TaxID=745531 RepID=A0A0C3S279_PHLG1|nr:hypothetical protein PHLGIDRAFT_121380 [Phlebiopsis gigantea 11061_1 CR5-6]
METTTVDLEIGLEQIQTKFYVTKIGKQDIILGMTWLQENNPNIDWAKGTIRLRPALKLHLRTPTRFQVQKVSTDFIPTDQPAAKHDKEVIITCLPDQRQAIIMDIKERTIDEAIEDVYIRLKVTPATTMAQPADMENSLPPEFQEYTDIFEKKSVECFSPSRP